jgi:hypothetical protein
VIHAAQRASLIALYATVYRGGNALILIDFIKSKKAIETLNEEELLYEFVAIELEQGAMSKGLWAKALAETEFDDLRARALYMRMRVAILREELRELVPWLSKLRGFLEQGCSREAIEYLREPILAITYTTKYGVSMKKIEHAISIGKIKGCLVDGCLWVQDRRFSTR